MYMDRYPQPLIIFLYCISDKTTVAHCYIFKLPVFKMGDLDFFQMGALVRKKMTVQSDSASAAEPTGASFYNLISTRPSASSSTSKSVKETTAPGSRNLEARAYHKSAHCMGGDLDHLHQSRR